MHMKFIALFSNYLQQFLTEKPELRGILKTLSQLYDSNQSEPLKKTIICNSPVPRNIELELL